MDQTEILGEGTSIEILRVEGAKAWPSLLELRKTRRGAVPVVFGAQEDYDCVVENKSFQTASYEELLQRSEAIDVPTWVARRFEEDPEYFSTSGPDAPSVQQSSPLTVAYEILTGRPKSDVWIGLIPVKQPWEVPAFLKPGNWNDCPTPEVHIAFFKYWYERYGAVITSMSSDVIEFSVSRPPSTKDAALALAKEQFAYCSDIVHQGVGTENNLAKGLLNSPNWYFWWD